MSFFGLLRVGEITSDNRNHVGVHTISYLDVNFIGDELHLTIKSSKSDQHGKRVVLVLKSQDSVICPVQLMRRYIISRCESTPSLPLFIHFDGSVLTRFQFTSVLNKSLKFCNATGNIRSHSFRIGGASDLARQGVPDSDIQKWGRWSSDAYSGYIRLNRM